MPATVERLEYDPNRTAFIGLVKYEDGTQAYVLAPQRLGVGDTIVAGKKTDVKPGNAMELSQMPVGTIVHNIEMKPGKGGQIARSAGTYAQVVGRDRGLVIVRLGSGEQRYIRGERSEEHTSELQSLMRNSYAVFCLKKKNNKEQNTTAT